MTYEESRRTDREEREKREWMTNFGADDVKKRRLGWL